MNDTLRALLDAAAAMWPAPAVVSRANEAALHDGRTTVKELLLVPNARHPKLAVPAGAPRAVAEVLGRTSNDLGLARRATRSALSGALRTPGVNRILTRSLSDRVRITAPVGAQISSLEAMLAELLDRDVVVSFGVGTARANRKPVVQALTPDGETLAYAKLGISTVGQTLVRGEAQALADIWSVGGDPSRLRIPRVLYAGAWQDLELLVMTPLQARARRVHDRRVLPAAAMHELGVRLGTSQACLTQTSFWKQIGDVPALARVTAPVEKRYGDQLVTLGVWHGDWTPWNMAWDGQRADECVLLWDFERFARDVPLGLDAPHYRLQTALRAGGEQQADSLLAGGQLVDGDRGNQPDLLTAVYLVELARRWVLASEPPEGAPLRPRTQWLLRRLEGQMKGRQQLGGRAR